LFIDVERCAAKGPLTAPEVHHRADENGSQRLTIP
jgi:hypothetical protein